MVDWIKRMWEKYQDIFWYGLFGGLTTVVNFVIFFGCNKIFLVEYYVGNFRIPGYMISNIIAWVGAVLFAYVTNRRWVFKSKVKGFANITKEMITFFGFRVLSLLMEMAILFLCIDLLGISEMLTKLIAQFVVIVANYVFSKLIIFRKPKNNLEKNGSKAMEEEV